MLYCVIILFF